MSLHRTLLVAFAALFATALSTAAFAGCGGCGFGYAAPVAYAPAPVYAGGCGGCGLAVTYAEPAPVPVVYAQGGCCGGCGGCGGAVAVTYVQPVVEPVAVMPAPIAVDHWDVGGFGGCGGCSRTFGYVQPAAAPMYVVNQGPEYSGPGLVVPYGSYSPATDLAAPEAYPYIGGPAYGDRRHWHHHAHAGYAPHPQHSEPSHYYYR